MAALPLKGLATSLVSDPKLMWEIPSMWSLEEASTVPMAYLTAYYSLMVRGRMRKGETVLIHAGSGGVGVAAIAVALSMDCKVFATVSSKEKREFLQKRFPTLMNDNFADSRDERDFEKVVRQGTQGRGVDIVLNSLALDKLQASIRCLAHYGRFIEIGKFDLFNNSDLGMEIFLKSITFHGILIDSLLQHESDEKEQVWRLLKEGTLSGVVQPLPYTIFSHEKIEEAFRFMASGKHMGKILIQIRDADGNISEIKPENQSLDQGGIINEKQDLNNNFGKVDGVTEFQEQAQEGATFEIESISANSSTVANILQNNIPRQIHAIRRTFFQPSKSYVVIGGL
ncbi:unnamed protein product, partial [Allacma fusca]